VGLKIKGKRQTPAEMLNPLRTSFPGGVLGLVKALFSYTGIGVRDLDRSIKFYTQYMGMRLVGRYKIKETNGEIAELRSPRGQQLLELNWYTDRKEYKNGDEIDHLAFEVEDVDTAVAELKARGVVVCMEPFDEGHSRLGFIQDPDGIWIELQSPKKQPKRS
jgi:lactoylglutathione lyase